MENPAAEKTSPPPQHRWLPLSAIDRRVLGVLAEKAKTTPDIYPMSLNAVTTGCNQKSNRAPLMQLEPADVEESLDRLREVGAVGLVEGYGRVQKYRHYMYEWLGVDKVELAVMTELLLRGDQTVGELRGRASRMEPIADLAALQPVLESLKSKGLLISLTPEGRGHAVSHALYKPRELEILRTRYQGGAPAESPGEPLPRSAPVEVSRPATVSRPSDGDSRPSDGDVEPLRRELATMREQVAQFRREFDELRDAQTRIADELQSFKDSLGG